MDFLRPITRSQDNTVADFESRRLETETEYELGSEAFRAICRTFGRLEIDLCGSTANSKCAKYVLWKENPGSVAIDAFTIE